MALQSLPAQRLQTGISNSDQMRLAHICSVFTLTSVYFLLTHSFAHRCRKESYLNGGPVMYCHIFSQNGSHPDIFLKVILRNSNQGTAVSKPDMSSCFTLNPDRDITTNVAVPESKTPGSRLCIIELLSFKMLLSTSICINWHSFLVKLLDWK